MGQFDSRTEASQARLDADEIASGGLMKVPGVVLDGGSTILDFLSSALSAVSPAVPSIQSTQLTVAALKNAISALRSLAGQRFELRVQYMLNSVAEDLKDVMEANDEHATRLKDLETKLAEPRSAEILTEAAVQAARATSERKLKHLSRVAVTGVVMRDKDPIEQVLEFERHVVELNESDISLLRIIEEFQAPYRKGSVFREDEWIENVRTGWQEMLRLRGYGELSARGARSSLARLQSRGLIIQVAGSPTKNSPGTEPYAILDEGSLFLVYLKGEEKTYSGPA